MATVKRIDPCLVQLEFTTETGSFLLTTTAALDDLHVGDQLLLCLHEDGSEDKDRIVKIPLQRTTESPEGHDRAGRDDR